MTDKQSIKGVIDYLIEKKVTTISFSLEGKYFNIKQAIPRKSGCYSYVDHNFSMNAKEEEIIAAIEAIL